MEKLKYYLLAIIACLAWGCAFAFIKITLEYAPTFQLSGLRFMLAGIILLPFLFGKNENWGVLLKEWKFVLLFSFFQIFTQYALYFAGIDLVPASVAAIIVGASPLVVFILAHIFMHNDRFTPTKVLSVIMGTAGIVTMTLKTGDFAMTNPYYLLGIALVLTSVTVNSSVNIIVAKNSRPISPIMLTAVSNFMGGVMLYACSFFETSRVPETMLPPVFWGYLLVLAIISSMGFSIWFYLLKVPILKVSEINIWKFVIPVFGAILSWIILPNDHPDFMSIIGIVLISIAIIILQVPSRSTK